MKEKTNEFIYKPYNFLKENIGTIFWYFVFPILLFHFFSNEINFFSNEINCFYKYIFYKIQKDYGDIFIIFLNKVYYICIVLFLYYIIKIREKYVSQEKYVPLKIKLLIAFVIYVYFYYINLLNYILPIYYELIIKLDFYLFSKEFYNYLLYKTEKYYKKEYSIDNNQLIFKDDPIESEKDDELGFNSLVNLFYDNLIGIELSNNSFSAGIVASWGKGKSSFLNLLANKAKRDENIVVRFNPRASKKVDNIQEEFFNTFSNELSKYYLNIGYNINNYIRALKILDNNIVNVFIDIFSTLNPNTEKDKINEAIGKIGKRIFVIIEDLDRLTKDEILEVFKIIDVNADFKNAIFVSAYDKNYINNILENEIGKDYTDKYFSYEYTLPETTRNKLVEIGEKYLEKALGNLEKDENNNFSSIDKDKLLNIWKSSRYYGRKLHKAIEDYDNNVVEYLYSIRDMKRYINLFLHCYINKKTFEHVNPKEFLLCILLRFKDPSIYNRLSMGYYVLEEYNYEVDFKKEEEKNIKLLGFSKWTHSKDILRILFKTNNQIFYENFDYYFEAIYKYSSSDFEDLLNPENTDNFLDKAEEIYKSSEQYRLIEFLRVKAKIGLKDETLKRFIYLIFHIQDYSLCNMIFSYDFIKYTNSYTKDSYKNELKNNILPHIIEKYTSDIFNIFYDIRQLKKSILFSDNELKDYLFCIQKQYYENIENNLIEFNSIKLIKSSIIKKENSDEIEEKAIENLFNFIINYADKFAKGIIDYGIHRENVISVKIHIIIIHYNLHNNTKFIEKLNNLIDNIENKYLKYITQYLVKRFNESVYLHIDEDSKLQNNKFDDQAIELIYNILKEMENSSN